MEDEQLAISGIPAAGRPHGAHGHRPTRDLTRRTSIQRHCETSEKQYSRPVSPTPPDADASEHPEALVARDVYALGVRTDLVTACRIALGIGSTTAYALAARGELPFPVHRVGRQWVVPTAGLLAFLGLPPPEAPPAVTPGRQASAQG